MITKDKFVTVSYELRTEKDGEILETAGADRPLEFICGQGQTLEYFEMNLLDKNEGDILNAQGTHTHGAAHGVLHGTAEGDALFKLLGDILGHKPLETFDFEKLKDHKLIDPSTIGLKGSPTNIFKSFTPPQKGAGMMLEGDGKETCEKLAGILADKHII